MTLRNRQRGYTLVVVMVLLLVLMVLGAGAIELATAEVESASGYRREVAMASCARAAKEAMISRLRFAQALPTQFSMEITNADGTTVLDLRHGHDPAAVPPRIEAVEFVNDDNLGKGRTGSLHANMTNDIPAGVGFGGSGSRVTARCRDELGRTTEIEFLIRYGI